MKEVVGHHVIVKTSRGIRTRKDASDMIEALAERLDASSEVSIIKEAQALMYGTRYYSQKNGGDRPLQPKHNDFLCEEY